MSIRVIISMVMVLLSCLQKRIMQHSQQKTVFQLLTARVILQKSVIKTLTEL